LNFPLGSPITTNDSHSQLISISLRLLLCLMRRPIVTIGLIQ